MAPKRSIKISIKGIEWTIFGETNSQFTRNHGNCAAVTYPEDSTIHFNYSHWNPGLIRHELLHAYVSSSSTESSNLKADQVEDLCCAILQEHGPEIMLFTDKIATFLLK